MLKPASTDETSPPIEVEEPKEQPRTAMAIPQVRRQRKMGLVVKIGAGVGALGVVIAGMFVYKALNPPPPPPITLHPFVRRVPPADGLSGKPGAPAAPGTPAAKAPGGLPGAIAAAKNAEQARVDALSSGNDASDTAKAAGAAATAAKPAAPAGPIEGATTIAPGVKATTDDVEAASTASVAFRSFVDDVKIGGVFQGSAPRALINGRIVRLGQTVDPGLGIVFSRLDTDEKLVVFTDPTGAVVSKKY